MTISKMAHMLDRCINWRTLAKNKLLKKGLSLITWHGFTAAISMLGSIWAARCLGPTNLGISGFIVSGVQQVFLLLNFIPGQYLVRIIKQKNSSLTERDILEFGISIRFFSSVAAVLIGYSITVFYDVPSEWKLAVFAGIPLIITNIMNTRWLLLAQEKQQLILATNFFAALLTTSLYFAFLRPSAAAGSDIIVLLISSTLSLFLMWKFAGVIRFWRYINFGKLKYAGAHLAETKYLYFTGFLIYVYSSLEMPLLGYLVSVDEMGKYRSAIFLAGAAKSITKLIPLLLYPRFLDWLQNSPKFLWKKQLQIFYALFFGCLFLSVVIWQLSPLIYTHLYGDEFLDAALPFAILFAAKMVMVLNGIFAWGLWSHSQDKAMLTILAVIAIISIALNFYLIPKYGMMAAATVNLISELLQLIITFYLSYRLSRKDRIVVEQKAFPLQTN